MAEDIFGETLDSIFNEKMELLDKLDELDLKKATTPVYRVLKLSVLSYRIRTIEKEYSAVTERYNRINQFSDNYYKLLEELG